MADGETGMPVMKQHVRIDDRQVDSLGGPASGGGMYGGYGIGGFGGFGGLGLGLGVGALAGGWGGGWGWGGGCGPGSYGQGLGSPLGVGFVGLGLAELASNQRFIATSGQIQGAERAQAAGLAAVGRDVLASQVQNAVQTGTLTREIFEARLQQARDTQAILSAICGEGRATQGAFALAQAQNAAAFAALGQAGERGFGAVALQSQANTAAIVERGIAQTNGLAAQSVAQTNGLAAAISALQCLEQECCKAQGTEGQATRNDVAAVAAALQQATRAIQATLCNVGTQANVNAARIGAGLPTPVAVPFPGGACSGNGAVAGC
jgi:hypothetical protein